MWKKGLLLAALFGGMGAWLPAATAAPSIAPASARIVIRGRLVMVPEPACFPEPGKHIPIGRVRYEIVAGSQRFRLELGDHVNRAHELLGQQVIVTGILFGKTVRVQDLKVPRDDALITYVHILPDNQVQPSHE
jgi:hypothetical protein